jgi:hypothetical protein
MRPKRRLIVVVRLITGSAQCKPGALISENLKFKEHLKNKVSCATGAILCRQELLTTESKVISAVSASKRYFNAETAEIRRGPQRKPQTGQFSAYEDAGNGYIVTPSLRTSRRYSFIETCQVFLSEF